VDNLYDEAEALDMEEDGEIPEGAPAALKGVQRRR